MRTVCGMVLACLTIAIATAGNVFDLSGSAANPFKDSHGKTVVLIFLRTDCPISNRYAPTIQELAHRYSSQVNFWLVYPGESQTTASIHKQLAEYGYRLPVLRDTRHELVDLSGVKVTPEAAVFDALGKLLYHGRIDDWYQDFGRARTSATRHELEDAIIGAAVRGKAPAAATAAAVGCSLADLE